MPFVKIRMQYRVSIYKGDSEGEAQENLLLTVGSYDFEPPFSGVVIRSLSAAIAAVLSVVKRIQSALLYNVHFIVKGRPVGTNFDTFELFALESGIDNAGDELVYIIGDHTQPALVQAMRRFNKQDAPDDPEPPEEEFEPDDVIPEVKQ